MRGCGFFVFFPSTPVTHIGGWWVLVGESHFLQTVTQLFHVGSCELICHVHKCLPLPQDLTILSSCFTALKDSQM